MPKRNYGYEKRQKELTRQRKKEEKQQRKIDRATIPPEDGALDANTSVELPPEK